ncbi:MAG: DEAD/DEAH box helicase [Bacilli bacterium]|nr:DEAD/DEAH box helicase [Bacilli bacterium]
MKQFTDIPIQEEILRGIEKKSYTEMTEVQEQVIPLALEKHDIMAQAPTGTGKTMAFAIPILQSLDFEDGSVQALILAPTRELALQITEEIRSVAYYQSKLKVVTLYGGEYIEKQLTSLRKKPQIVVATPGRLMDHMRRETVSLDHIKMLVLDEADEMLNMGFREDIDEILKSVLSEHQTMLFSATITGQIEAIAKTYLKDPDVIRINKNQMTVSTITQNYIEVKEKDKIEVMSRIIDIYGYELVIVFCNTKRMVDEVTSSLLTRGFIVEALHGDMKQMQRDRVMNRFRTGTINILVASDVAARGLDIDDVDVVFNYDVPTDQEYYVHRVGRTGRAQKEGLAITLVTNREKYALRDIVAYSKATITKMEIPSLEKVMKIRIERLLHQAMESNNPKFEKIVHDMIEESITEETNAYHLISGLIMMQLNISSGNDIKEEKPSKNKVARVYIGLGKLDRLRVPEFVDLLMRKTSLTNRDINNIDMHDAFTFFDIPAHLVDEVALAFTTDEKGRKILVEVAKEAASSRKRKERDIPMESLLEKVDMNTTTNETTTPRRRSKRSDDRPTSPSVEGNATPHRSRKPQDEEVSVANPIPEAAPRRTYPRREDNTTSLETKETAKRRSRKPLEDKKTYRKAEGDQKRVEWKRKEGESKTGFKGASGRRSRNSEKLESSSRSSRSVPKLDGGKATEKGKPSSYKRVK